MKLLLACAFIELLASCKATGTADKTHLEILSNMTVLALNAGNANYCANGGGIIGATAADTFSAMFRVRYNSREKAVIQPLIDQYGEQTIIDARSINNAGYKCPFGGTESQWIAKYEAVLSQLESGLKSKGLM